MLDLLVTHPESLYLLYGEYFYIHPSDALPSSSAPAVEEPTTANPTLAKPIANAPQTKLEPVADIPASKPGIIWRPKPTSKVLFVLQLSEFKNPNLTEFLKKIVDSLGLSAEFIGFGQIEGPVDLREFDRMPNPYAVVFDNGVWGGAENPVKLGKGEVFFAQNLLQLQSDQEGKRILWDHLKQLKEKLS